MATTTTPQPRDSTARPRRLAEQDLDFDTTLDVTQFRAALQGFPESRPWGRATPASSEEPVTTARVRLSQRAAQDLRALFGHRALPRILAALDQLAATDWDQTDWDQTDWDRAVTLWRHFGVCGYQVLFRPLVAARSDTGYLVAAVVPSRTVGWGAHRRRPEFGPGPDRRLPEGLGRCPGPAPIPQP
jgi:hypothetical protein